jgi:hypothetical protein
MVDEFVPAFNATQLAILDAEVITIFIVYMVLIILIGVNSWFFMWKLKEYKNIHSVAFYVLSFMVCVCR